MSKHEELNNPPSLSALCPEVAIGFALVEEQIPEEKATEIIRKMREVIDVLVADEKEHDRAER